MEKSLWIIEEDFSQDWRFSPVCFYRCTELQNPEQKEMCDRYMVKEVGEDPAKYGYVKMEGEGLMDTDDNRIIFCADTEAEMDHIYRCIAESFLHHPGVIDMRGFMNDIKIV